MSRNRWKFSKATIAIGVFALAVGLLAALTALVAGGPATGNRMGLVDDWTHHHLVFSNPGTFADAMRTGSFLQWYKIVNNPRYIMQQMKRNPGQRALATAPDFATLAGRLSAPISDWWPIRKRPERPPKQTLKKDWTMSLAGSTTTGAMGVGQYPAKYTFTTSSASCNDYVAYDTGLAGTSTQATVIAYNNIYATTCGSTVPTIHWAYNTGGTATLSPVISWEGDQVAYIQTSTSVASLVLLRMANSGGTVGSPATITSVANGSYYGCTAPCYTTFTLNGNPNDTNSPPFYDYWHDTIYVGDNSGKLHKFNPVFSGTPAEVLTSGAPWASVSANILTGPVYDPVSTNVFVADSGGYLYRVSSAAAVTASGHLTVTGSTGIVDAPLVDTTPTTPLVYVFLGDSDSVVQFSATFGSGTSGISEALGSSATTTKVYAGAFDNTHYTGSGTTGNLYVCGYHSSGTTPRLYQIAMTATFNGAVTTVSTDPASSTATCSPITEFLDTSVSTTLTAALGSTGTTATADVTSSTGFTSTNYIQIDSEIMLITGTGTGTLTVTRAELGTTEAAHSIGAAVSEIHDWIYLSVTANGQATGCTGACLYNYAVFTLPSNATAGLAETGGTSGIVIDNGSTTTGASQIYFSTLGAASCTGNGTTGSGSHGCAVQASQSAP